MVIELICMVIDLKWEQHHLSVVIWHGEKMIAYYNIK